MKGARSVTVAASVTFAAAAGYAFGLATAPDPALAQMDATAAEMEVRFAAIEAQLPVLQQEIAALKSQQGDRATVQAPFRVVAEGNREVLSVTLDGGLPVVRIGQGISLGYAQSEPFISISNGARVAGMDLSGGNATLFAGPNAEDGFYAGYSANSGIGARVFAGGQSVAELLGYPGGHAALRLLSEGGLDFSVEPGEGEQPELKLGEGIILGYSESEPRVSIFSGDRVAGMHMLDGVATIYASQDGTNGFFAGPSPTFGNSVRIFDGGEAVASVGVPPGKMAGARFLAGGTLVAGIGIGTAGEGVMYTAFPDGSPAVTAGGNGAGSAQVSVHQGGSVRASINTSDLGGTGLVVVRDAGGTAVAYLSEGAAGGGSVSVTGPGGDEAFGAGWDGTQGAACVRRQNGNQFCLEPVMPLSRQN
ncbi:MAG: hypothetical protein R3F55_06780 [Alphaproteobacteria bacterium]